VPVRVASEVADSSSAWG